MEIKDIKKCNDLTDFCCKYKLENRRTPLRLCTKTNKEEHCRFVSDELFFTEEVEEKKDDAQSWSIKGELCGIGNNAKKR
ncbi:MAG: hypothetical protein A3K77_00680 [Euryarchaeota archaeon RBG_13_31_8]|nr:MAG: hypothetical protein A3K77_00680 [Euryarchaeota archaeon RBG_13_31_8]